MRTVAIVDGQRHESTVVDVIGRHRPDFDAFIVVVSRPSRATRAALLQLTRTGEPVVVMSASPSGLDLDAVVENTFRHFRPDFCVVLDAGERVVLDGPRSLRQAIRRARKARHSAAGPGEPSPAIEAIPNPYLHPHMSPLGLRGVSTGPAPRRPAPAIGRLLARRRPERDAVSVIAGAVAAIRGESGAYAQPEESGVLGADFHAEKPYLDLPPFVHTWARFGPSSVLDLGCGLGGYLALFTALGTREVIGVDGFPPTPAYLGGTNYIEHDLRKPLDLGRRFDLVVCTEVIEHMADQFERSLLDSIDRHAMGTILFSAARPDQPGEGHVNCKPIEHWLESWRLRGWFPDAFDTLAVRSLSSYHWFRRNLVILRPQGHERNDTFTEADLPSLEFETVPWTDQPPGVIANPLSFGVPRIRHG
jgi:SAM-dependent methyltransferase